MKNSISTPPTADILAFTRVGSPIAIGTNDRKVVKRDGTQVPFDRIRVVRAIALAIYEVRNATTVNPFRNDALLQYGLADTDMLVASEIGEAVERMLETFYSKGHLPTIEQVQNAVEFAIAAAGQIDVAHAFMVYRAAHAQRRLKDYPDNGGMAAYIEHAKYARYRADLGRREIFPEITARVEGMHREFFHDKLGVVGPLELSAKERDLAGDHAAALLSVVGGKTLDQIIAEVFKSVAAKRVLPSMRSLQFGGKAILAKHSRMFNCSFSNVDRIEFFREYFYLLLSGCGVGFSVQKHHVDYLPPLPSRGAENDLEVVHYHIDDSIEGWADALHALLVSFYDGHKAEFDYSAIRARGKPLKTTGGKAPGHLPLKKALHQVEEILIAASGRNLRPIEVYDINMFVAKAVLAGGIRRSATICLFSPDDEEMMNAKTGDWFSKHPQRSASNNSAVVNRSDDNKALFMRLYEAQKAFGEPGFFFSDLLDAGANPCAEIGLNPTIDGAQLTPEDVEKLYRYRFAHAAATKGSPSLAQKRSNDQHVLSLRRSTAASVPVEDTGSTSELAGLGRMSGFQMCNLTTINAGANHTEEELAVAAIHAATIGTLQAAYTQIDYLSPVTRVINERDALLGVSICGFMANPELYLDPAVLARVARLARATNRVVARMIGINHAARLATVKPEGTAALILGTSSGIHPFHARNYFRRVQANRKEEGYIKLKEVNPQMTEVSVYNPETDDVITFPASAPKGAYVAADLNALTFLKIVKAVQMAWVLNGQDEDSRDPTLHHNVSNTCRYLPEESAELAQFIWDNRRDFTGISLLKASGDTDYAQAPNQSVVTEADILKWNALNPKPVDFTLVKEADDNTELSTVAACAGGGSCELR